MVGAPLDRTEFARWRVAADRALGASAAQAEAGFPEWACFLAEQAAQLALKGLLHGIGVGAWGHDLTELAARVSTEIGPPWPDAAASRAERLARFYLPTRYPDALPGGVPGDRFSAEDVAAACEDAAGLLATVDSTWTALEES